MTLLKKITAQLASELEERKKLKGKIETFTLDITEKKHNLNDLQTCLIEFPKKLKGFEAQVIDAYSLFTQEERLASCSRSLMPTGPSKLQLLLFRFNFSVLSEVFSKHNIEVNVSSYDSEYLPVKKGLMAPEKIQVSLPLHMIVCSILKQQSESIAIIDSHLPAFLRNITFVVSSCDELSSLIVRIWISFWLRRSLSWRLLISCLDYLVQRRRVPLLTQRALLSLL